MTVVLLFSFLKLHLSIFGEAVTFKVVDSVSLRGKQKLKFCQVVLTGFTI